MLVTDLNHSPYSRWEDVCYPVSTILEMAAGCLFSAMIAKFSMCAACSPLNLKVEVDE